MNKHQTILCEQCVPILFPKRGGPASILIGMVGFTVYGLCTIGPHSFYYAEPIEIEYEGFQLFRGPKSNTVEVTNPFGEVYRYRYFANRQTWMEVRVFEKSASCWPAIERFIRDAFEQDGPVVATLGLVLATVMTAYLVLLWLPIYVLYRGALYVVLLLLSLVTSFWLFETLGGQDSTSKAGEAMVAAYFFPIGFMVLAAAQVAVAAWKHRSLWSGTTWRNIAWRLVCVVILTCGTIWVYSRDVPLRTPTFVAAWGRLFGEPSSPVVPVRSPTQAQIPWGIQQALEELRRSGESSSELP